MLARFVCGFLLLASLAAGQQKTDLSGEYDGHLGPLSVKLHVTTAPDGSLSGTVDSPQQNLVGVPCSDFHLNGNSLSFRVPMANGSWIGFVSPDGNTLSGMWNQGYPMQLDLKRVVATAAIPAGAANAAVSPAGPGDVKWDDYTFKYNPTGTMAEVYEGNKVVGSILTVNGQQQVLPLPGTDGEKLKKSFADYQAFSARNHSGTPPAAAATAPQPTPVPAAAVSPPAPAMPGSAPSTSGQIQFDDGAKSVTVPQPDGVKVVFVGEDVKVYGYRRGNYILRHQKGSAGRFLEHDVLHSQAAGGSLSGGGIEFLHEGGGIIYDSGMGGYNLQESPQVLMAKQLSQIAVAAVTDVRKVSGHETFTPPGYNTIKEISQYRLRSDGSR